MKQAAFLFLLLLGGNDLYAATSLEQQQPLENGRSLEELSAVITDRTVTHIGHEFYRLFTLSRQLRHPDSLASLVVRERPSARWGNLLWIEYQHQKIFETIWVPGRGLLAELADQAINHTQQQIQQIQLRQLVTNSYDLGQNEF